MAYRKRKGQTRMRHENNDCTNANEQLGKHTKIDKGAECVNNDDDEEDSTIALAQ